MQTTTELSVAEFEILVHYAWGYRRDGIAYKLEISPQTVKWYVSSILRKLGAVNVSNAVAIAYREGILQMGDLAGWANAS